MPTRGIKRKFPDWEESVLDGHLSFQTDSYSFFRQSLLNMSLEKFNKGRMMIEPSLRRYVLIANTLRVIQEEIRHENPCAVPNLEGVMSGVCDPLSGNVVAPVLPQDLENVVLPSMEDDFSVTATIASILKELESVLDESCPQNLQPRLSMQEPENKHESSNNVGSRVPQSDHPPCDREAAVKGAVFSAEPRSLRDTGEIELIRELVLAASCAETSEPMDTSLMGQVPAVSSPMDTSGTQEVNSQASTIQSPPSVPPEELKASEAVFGSFEIMNSSYLNDVSFDDPFSDIDTSVFEKETSLTGTAPSSRLSSSEDLLFPSSCNSVSYNSSQGLREPNDLDNIIGILVGS
ncbi:cell division cycle-associated protein 4-like [Hyla sarda]|uniref:cell division cycle-associated protein 4-like n=1 Tax=Hyla sarda TaxID=327740 RepID=UPI0024C311C4|nr:cell division cycle-associated protein 4-like [Hyla sarda]